MIELLLIGSAFGLICYGVRPFLPAKGKELGKVIPQSSEGKPIKIKLEECSGIWTQKKMKVKLEDLAKNWIEATPVEDVATPVAAEVEFRNQETLDFYNKYIKNNKHFLGVSLDSIMRILRLLDEEGGCPSVVSVERDSDSSLKLSSPNMFTFLARTTLRRHSFNVADEIMSLFSDNVSMLSKGLLVALGHDLGKLPRISAKHYALGDHPTASIIVLEEMPEFMKLPYAAEITKAIKFHHKSPEKDLLSVYLRDADGVARRKEFALNADEPAVAANSNIPAISAANDEASRVFDIQMPKAVHLVPVEGQNDGVKRIEEVFASGEVSGAAIPAPVRSEQIQDNGVELFGRIEKPAKKLSESEIAKALSVANCGSDSPNTDIMGRDDLIKGKDVIMQEVPLPWLDLDVLIKALSRHINTMSGGRWSAFSMSNGYVYVMSNVLWEEAKTIARRKKEVYLALGDSDKAIKRNVLYSIVKALRAREDTIVREMVCENYYMSQFEVEMRDGRKLSMFYVPFHVDGFNMSVANLEKRKFGKLKDIINVTPKSSTNREMI